MQSTLREYLESLVVTVILALFGTTFVVQAFKIPTPSMEDNLLVGDHLFVDRTTAAPVTSWIKPLIPYSDIRHGDIIVFISPVQAGLHVVKRIIGVPGDRLRLRNGIVYRNGTALDERYVIRDGTYIPYRDEFPSFPGGLGNATEAGSFARGTVLTAGCGATDPTRCSGSRSFCTAAEVPSSSFSALSPLACAPASRVTDSVKASAARSRSVKNGVSRHTGSE